MNGFRLNENDEESLQNTLKPPLALRINGSGKPVENRDHFADEMLESEKSSLVGRVHDLEKRVLTQQDEIVCLRSTLADVLRRVNQLEGQSDRGTPSTGRSAPSTPARNGGSFSARASPTPYSQPPGHTDWKLRKPMVRQGSTTEARRSATLHHTRSKTSHQSNGSLHSDGTPSSTSVSPAPSPSPRPNTSQGVLQQHSGLGKRWNSTGDFNTQSPLQARLATKSLLNLASKSPVGHVFRHGTHTTSYNEDDGTVKLFLRGRPVVFHAPTEVRDTYDISKVSPAPGRKLRLDWVYGYRGRDCRANLHQMPTGEMAYFVAAAVVLYNAEEQTQRHYLGHTDDVRSLTVHPNKLLVATGQCAGHERRDGMPHVRVWNSVSLATVAVIGVGEFAGSVNCLSFSRADAGAYLVAVDDAPDRTISVWEWQRGDKGHRITETKCSVDTIVGAEFHPLDRNQIVTIGKNHICFWTLDQGGALYKRMGVFEGRDKPKYVTCMAFTANGDTVTGDSNGNVIVWGRGTNTIAKFIRRVHDGSIFSLCATKDGGIVSGGGKDGRLVLFDVDLNPLGTQVAIEPHFGGVRVVSEGRGTQLLVGTTRNCILTGSLELGLSPVVMGHTDELWGLATHPTLPHFVTGGRDRLLQMWDSLSHSVVWSKDIGEQVQSCCFSPSGDTICVGGITGRWLTFDSTTRELLDEHVDGQEAIQVVRFSPDGAFLALGSRDNGIYVYQVNGNGRRYSKIGKCAGHSSFITHLDWSEDSKIMRTNSGDYELLYWNPTTCRQVTNPSSLRDNTWATHSCTLTFETLGIWPENADGTDVNTASRSHDGKLIATGDDWGKVKLFGYPACQPKSLAHVGCGHSSHVTAVEFLQEDARLISTGGHDTSVMQWTIG
uniref:Putative echinoderm microtubule-associated protein-like 1 n=2 Tax=Nyssomyia neivai TaxID=330878 RepID=A0A1L8E5X0_9DIPT